MLRLGLLWERENAVFWMLMLWMLMLCYRGLFLFQNTAAQCAVVIVPLSLCHAAFPGAQNVSGAVIDSGSISLLFEGGVPHSG